MQKLVWLVLFLVGIGFCTYSRFLPGTELVNNLRLMIGSGILVGLAMWRLILLFGPSYNILPTVMIGLLVYLVGDVVVLRVWGLPGHIALVALAATHLACTQLLWSTYDDRKMRDRLILLDRIGTIYFGGVIACLVIFLLSTFVNDAYANSTNAWFVGIVGAILLAAGCVAKKRVGTLRSER
jgi:hypothetical protein